MSSSASRFKSITVLFTATVVAICAFCCRSDFQELTAEIAPHWRFNTSGTIRRLSFCSNGQAIAVSNASGDATVLEVGSFRTHTEFRGWDRPQQVAVGNGGKWIASVSATDQAVIWDADSGHILMSLPDTIGQIHSLSLSKKGGFACAGTNRGWFTIWRIDNEAVSIMYSKEISDATIAATAISPIEHQAAAVTSSGLVVIDLISGGVAKRDDLAYSSALAYSCDGSILATQSTDLRNMQGIHLIDTKSKQTGIVLPVTGTVESLCFSSNDQLLGAATSTLGVFNSRSGNLLLYRMNVHCPVVLSDRGPFVSVSFSPDGGYVSGARLPANEICVWRSEQYEGKKNVGQVVFGVGQPINSIAFCGEGRFLAVSDFAGGLRTIDLGSLRLQRSFKGRPSEYAISVGGEHDNVIGLIGSNGDFMALNSKDGTIQNRLVGGGHGMQPFVMSRSGRRACTVEGNVLTAWQLDDGHMIQQFKRQFDKHINAAAISPNDEQVAVATASGVYLLGNDRAIERPDLVDASSLVYSVDGSILLVGQKDIYVLHPTNGSTKETVAIDGTVKSLAISPDAKSVLFASYGTDKERFDRLTIYRFETQDRLLLVDNGLFGSTAWSQDGRYVCASKYNADEIRIWETAELLVGRDKPAKQ